MYAACVVFLMVWIAYAWALKGALPPPDAAGNASIEVRAPLFREDCDAREVPCVDDCSFLCVDGTAECVGGVCQSRKGAAPIACDERTGIRVMVRDPVPAWKCVCADSRFYGGEACDRQNPDVCENGVFAYASRSRYLCVCKHPFELVQIDWKPHCVEKKLMGFYDEATMNRKLISVS